MERATFTAITIVGRAITKERAIITRSKEQIPKIRESCLILINIKGGIEKNTILLSQ